MTQVPAAMRVQLFNAALFTARCRKPTFTNMLTGPAPKDVKGKLQTDYGAPIVEIRDLAAAAGDEVTVDIVNDLNKMPTMGDRKLAGRGESLSFASMNLKIDQGRHMVEAGGRMTQKRTKHNLNTIANRLLGRYYPRLEDAVVQAHLSGARGDYLNAKSILPTEAHEEFAEQMVNSITPPTFDRHLYGGNATSLDSIDAADIFLLDVVDRLALMLDEADAPLEPVKFPTDELADEAPMYVLFVSPRQWNDFYTATTTKDWQMMVANASSRAKGFSHPLFKGEYALWRNILVKKMAQPTRFLAGSNVTVCTNTNNAVTATVQPGVTVDRAILLGAQALANAYGDVGGKAKGHFTIAREKVDHGNGTETSICWMNGKKKIRFADKNGRINDFGVAVVDTAVTGL